MYVCLHNVMKSVLVKCLWCLKFHYQREARRPSTVRMEFTLLYVSATYSTVSSSPTFPLITEWKIGGTYIFQRKEKRKDKHKMYSAKHMSFFSKISGYNLLFFNYPEENCLYLCTNVQQLHWILLFSGGFPQENKKGYSIQKIRVRPA